MSKLWLATGCLFDQFLKWEWGSKVGLHRLFPVVLATAMCCAPAALHAEDGVSIIEPASAEASAPLLTIPSLTEVVIEILADLGSKTSKQGDTFPIRLASAIVVDGREVLPVGTEGVGEVIHAKGNGGMGASGELILTARYLEVGDRRLPLRTFRAGVLARDRIETVNSLAVASAAVAPLVSLAGFFIKGNQVVVSSGTIATARTAADFTIELPPTPAAAAPDAPAAESASEPTTEGVVQ